MTIMTDKGLDTMVALAYFSGVKIPEIAKNWKMPDSTARNYVRNGFSTSNPLVEFYRLFYPHDSARNAVHHYIRVKEPNRQEIPPEHLNQTLLIFDNTDHTYTNLIDSHFFDPRESKVIADTNLEKVFSAVPENPSPYYHLMRKAFGFEGYREARKFAEPFILGRLKEAYQKEARIDLNAVYVKVAEDIFRALRMGLHAYKTVPPEHYAATQSEPHQKIEDALKTLKPNEEKVLRMEFGIGSEKYDSLKAIEREIGVSGSRVGQIEQNALRKLSHPLKRLRNLVVF